MSWTRVRLITLGFLRQESIYNYPSKRRIWRYLELYDLELRGELLAKTKIDPSVKAARRAKDVESLKSPARAWMDTYREGTCTPARERWSNARIEALRIIAAKPLNQEG